LRKVSSNIIPASQAMIGIITLAKNSLIFGFIIIEIT
jgi:hypothetical protein